MKNVYVLLIGVDFISKHEFQETPIKRKPGGGALASFPWLSGVPCSKHNIICQVSFSDSYLGELFCSVLVITWIWVSALSTFHSFHPPRQVRSDPDIAMEGPLANCCWEKGHGTVWKVLTVSLHVAAAAEFPLTHFPAHRFVSISAMIYPVSPFSHRCPFSPIKPHTTPGLLHFQKDCSVCREDNPSERHSLLLTAVIQHYSKAASTFPPPF